MRPAGGVAVVFLRALIDSGARAGVDPSRVLRQLQLDRSVLDDLNGWIPVDVMTRAWELVPELSGDPDFGIHAAEMTPPGVYGVLEFATISSPNGAAAFERVERYYRLMGAMSEVRFLRDGARARISIRPVVSAISDLRHYFEHFFTIMVTRLAMLTSSEARPYSVAFTHARPTRTDEQTRIFGREIRFSQTQAEVVFDMATLLEPLKTSNAELAGILGETERTLAPTANGTTTGRLQRELAGMLSTGDVRLSSLARRLGLSTRTLQRKLTEEGVSYTVLVDDVRRGIALRLVQEQKTTLGEIAFVLGFSHPSAFHRAFRRWTGKTPHEIRSGEARDPRRKGSTKLARKATSRSTKS